MELESRYTKRTSRLLTATESSVAEGNNSLTGLDDVYNIKWLIIETTSTDWTLTIYADDGYSTGALEIVSNRDGDFNIHLDMPWEDDDGTGEFHYNFTSASGSETHDITFRGESLR
ncbi:MAG: hypothetical protein GY847_01825 [Proteobacteria bacterium]|nr:hypothetical protein [Pseudomonadota bacterium]